MDAMEGERGVPVLAVVAASLGFAGILMVFTTGYLYALVLGGVALGLTVGQLDSDGMRWQFWTHIAIAMAIGSLTVGVVGWRQADDRGQPTILSPDNRPPGFSDSGLSD